MGTESRNLRCSIGVARCLIRSHSSRCNSAPRQIQLHGLPYRGQETGGPLLQGSGRQVRGRRWSGCETRAKGQGWGHRRLGPDPHASEQRARRRSKDDGRMDPCAEIGACGPALETWSKTTLEIEIKWSKPSFEDIRFGFEITMYIATR